MDRYQIGSTQLAPTNDFKVMQNEALGKLVRDTWINLSVFRFLSGPSKRKFLHSDPEGKFSGSALETWVCEFEFLARVKNEAKRRGEMT